MWSVFKRRGLLSFYILSRLWSVAFFFCGLILIDLTSRKATMKNWILNQLHPHQRAAFFFSWITLVGLEECGDRAQQLCGADVTDLPCCSAGKRKESPCWRMKTFSLAANLQRKKKREKKKVSHNVFSWSVLGKTSAGTTVLQFSTWPRFGLLYVSLDASIRDKWTHNSGTDINCGWNTI